MVQLIAIYLLGFGDADCQRMFTRLDIGQFDFFRNDIGTRTPVGTREVGRSNRLFHLFFRISFFTDIRSQTFLQPHTRSRVETAERGTVVTPGDKVQHFFPIHRDNILLLDELVTTAMSAMSGHDIFQPYILRTFRYHEIGGYVFAGKDIGIGLSDVVNSVHQRLDMSLCQGVARDIRLVHIDRHAGDIAFGSPCVDKDTHISAAFQ